MIQCLSVIIQTNAPKAKSDCSQCLSCFFSKVVEDREQGARERSVWFLCSNANFTLILMSWISACNKARVTGLRVLSTLFTLLSAQRRLSKTRNKFMSTVTKRKYKQNQDKITSPIIIIKKKKSANTSGHQWLSCELSSCRSFRVHTGQAEGTIK